LGYIQPAGGYGITPLEAEEIVKGDTPNAELIVPDEETFDTVAKRDLGEEYLLGTSGNDLLLGSSSADAVSGEGGDDWLIGQDGDDLLFGGEGNDVLRGDSGDDQLKGNAGNDLLVGGPGDDTYVYAPGHGIDEIRNAAGGVDWLLLTEGLTENRLTYHRCCDDLVVRVDNDPQQEIWILDWFLGGEFDISYIQPFEGTGIPPDTINESVTPCQ
jgi:hypothetical protein